MKTNRARKETNPEIGEVMERTSPALKKKVTEKMLLAARIDDIIQAKGWNKSTFASKLEKRPSEITKWLSGTHNFTFETLIDIAEVLGIEVLALFAEQGKVINRPEKFVRAPRAKRTAAKS